jgi:hypothetical protein
MTPAIQNEGMRLNEELHGGGGNGPQGWRDYLQTGLAGLADILSAGAAAGPGGQNVRQTNALGNLEQLRQRREALVNEERNARIGRQREDAKMKLERLDRNEDKQARKSEIEAARWDRGQEKFWEGNIEIARQKGQLDLQGRQFDEQKDYHERSLKQDKYNADLRAETDKQIANIRTEFQSGRVTGSEAKYFTETLREIDSAVGGGKDGKSLAERMASGERGKDIYGEAKDAIENDPVLSDSLKAKARAQLDRKMLPMIGKYHDEEKAKREAKNLAERGPGTPEINRQISTVKGGTINPAQVEARIDEAHRLGNIDDATYTSLYLKLSEALKSADQFPSASKLAEIDQRRMRRASR